MVHPGMTGNCERIHISAGKLMVLNQILGIPQVPPDIRITHTAARQQELEHDDQHQPNSQERRPCAQPETRRSLNWSGQLRYHLLGKANRGSVFQNLHGQLVLTLPHLERSNCPANRNRLYEPYLWGAGRVSILPYAGANQQLTCTNRWWAVEQELRIPELHHLAESRGLAWDEVRGLDCLT